MPSVALATCAALPSGDEDGDALIAELADAGLDAEWQVWDADGVDWSHDLVVVRSTWDYTLAREDFLAWTRQVARLANPAPVIAWNSDKIYLRDLAEAAIPVVETSFAAPGDHIELPHAQEFVLKPSVGAGSKGAGRFAVTQHEQAREHARHLHAAGRTVLLQPYLTGVDSVGESSLIYLEGQFSHAITKAAMLPAGAVNPLDAPSRAASDSLYLEERIRARIATPDELAIGELVVTELTRRFGGPLLYARVDLLPTATGPVIVEVELAEPSLFLQFADGAAARFAAAIAGRT
ncbi:MAG: hypothetical protein M3N95_03465 [Actinomycetota bacterium]|nr:hypothetical protein [Actinomycetota bacterium]